MLLIEGQHLVAQQWVEQVRDPHARGAHRMNAALAEVVGLVPHQLHGLAELLRDGRRLERGVGKQVAAERAAALRHVHLHLRQRQPEAQRELLLRPGRGFRR
jgi:hypothetical protein